MSSIKIPKFRTKYDIISDRSLRHFTNPGSPELNTYSLRFDENGAEILIPNGQINIYNRIQADAEATDISNIFAKFCNGDTEALNRIPGAYFDARNMPKTYTELLNMIRSAEDNFYSLPKDIKEAFHNSPSEFWNSYGSEEFNKKFTDIINPTLDSVADDINSVGGEINE